MQEGGFSLCPVLACSVISFAACRATLTCIGSLGRGFEEFGKNSASDHSDADCLSNVLYPLAPITFTLIQSICSVMLISQNSAGDCSEQVRHGGGRI
jgi:hypothetical protein